MRPIDADALKEVFRGEEGAKALDHFPLRFIKVKQIIDNAPTIDAIPVAWLREKIKEHTDEEGWQDYLANSFGLCIEEWQNEQEARA